MSGPLDPITTPRLDNLLSQPDGLYRAQARVTWDHYAALLQLGIPSRDLVRQGALTFGIATIHGREMIVTADNRLRGYLTGPVMAAWPGASAVLSGTES